MVNTAHKYKLQFVSAWRSKEGSFVALQACAGKELRISGQVKNCTGGKV
jgi:hypothetical protein